MPEEDAFPTQEPVAQPETEAPVPVEEGQAEAPVEEGRAATLDEGQVNGPAPVISDNSTDNSI